MIPKPHNTVLQVRKIHIYEEMVIIRAPRLFKAFAHQASTVALSERNWHHQWKALGINRLAMIDQDDVGMIRRGFEAQCSVVDCVTDRAHFKALASQRKVRSTAKRSYEFSSGDNSLGP